MRKTSEQGQSEKEGSKLREVEWFPGVRWSAICRCLYLEGDRGRKEEKEERKRRRGRRKEKRGKRKEQSERRGALLEKNVSMFSSSARTTLCVGFLPPA
jgi:hypothetical protein